MCRNDISCRDRSYRSRVIPRNKRRLSRSRVGNARPVAAAEMSVAERRAACNSRLAVYTVVVRNFRLLNAARHVAPPSSGPLHGPDLSPSPLIRPGSYDDAFRPYSSFDPADSSRCRGQCTLRKLGENLLTRLPRLNGDSSLRLGLANQRMHRVVELRSFGACRMAD